jgi:hypothetical protein
MTVIQSVYRRTGDVTLYRVEHRTMYEALMSTHYALGAPWLDEEVTHLTEHEGLRAYAAAVRRLGRAKRQKPRL